MVNRVSTSSLHQQNLRDIGLVQSDIAKLNKQISSGKKADNFAELNGIVERVSGYESKLSSINIFLSNNNAVSNRLNVMDNSVSQLQTVAEQFASLLALRRNPASAPGLNFVPQAQALLDSISQTLNVSVEGRFLFGGSKTDTQPVEQPMPYMTTAGVPDDNYYKGNSDQLSVRVSDSLQIPYGVTANEQSFQNLIGSIRTAIYADKNNQEELLDKSLDLLNESIDGLAGVRADIGSNLKNLENINDQHEQLKIYWKQALDGDTGTDIAEATIQLSVDQTVLQATFSSFAKISQLRLTDFLN